MLKNIQSIFYIIASMVILAGCCPTGSTLRTARVLNPGDFEISAGLAQNETLTTSPLVIAAYGITDRIEVEARYEEPYVALTPRVQLLKSEISYIDSLAFFEIGYSGEGNFQWGPGLMIGRRWSFVEPYLSYRFRHFSNRSRVAIFDEFLQNDYHYVKGGTRLYFPYLWGPHKYCPSGFFFGIEAGPTLSNRTILFEWAANLGFQY